jgi:protein-S-isoprenylcysteine O-methyltransferase Ste14
MGERYRYYRIFFNLFSLATLIPLLIYSHSDRWSTEPLFSWQGNLRIIQYGLIALAVILVVTGARHYSMPQFLGVQQILRKKSGNAMTESGQFDSSGILGVMRHPWYVAVFILLWASDQNRTGIIINLILSGYLIIGTLLEERKLVLEFGDRYRQYQDKVSMFIPVKWVKTKIHRGRLIFPSQEASYREEETNFGRSHPSI